MTWVVPVELEEAVYAAAREVVGDAPLATSALTKAIVDRSKRYTSERDRLAQPKDRTGDLAARAAFFTIADAMKIGIPLGELAGRGALPARRPLRVLDLGAGCGAMSLGIIASLEAATGPGETSFSQRDASGVRSAPSSLRADGAAFHPPDLEILAVDRDVDALRIGGSAMRKLADQRGIVVDVTTRSADVDTTSLPASDLIVLGTVLNELAAPARVSLIQRALAALEPEGAVIIIEPALRDTSRALHELRDDILRAGSAAVFAPCTRQGAPCPALANPDDWCHEDRPVALPPRTAELARLTHLRDSGLKFAYLVLRKTALPLVEKSPAWRVVSAPFTAKGKLEVFGCSDAGRVPLRLLKRNRSDANRSFERAERGDVVVVDAPVPPAVDGRVEIEADTAVTRHEPARR